MGLQSTASLLKSGKVTLSSLFPPKNELAPDVGIKALRAEQAEPREVPAWDLEPPGFSGSQ